MSNSFSQSPIRAQIPLSKKLVTEAREAGRSVSLVTSDKDVRSTVGFGPGGDAFRAAFVRDVEVSDTAIDDLQRETGRTRMT